MSLNDTYPDHLVIGTKKPRRIRLYPLSIADQREFINTLVDGWNEFIVTQGNLDPDQVIDYAAAIYSCVAHCLENLLEYVTDGEDPEALMQEMTNDQAMTLLDKVYVQNFGDLDLKKKMIAQYLMLISVEL